MLIITDQSYYVARKRYMQGSMRVTSGAAVQASCMQPYRHARESLCTAVVHGKHVPAAGQQHCRTPVDARRVWRVEAHRDACMPVHVPNIKTGRLVEASWHDGHSAPMFICGDTVSPLPTRLAAARAITLLEDPAYCPSQAAPRTARTAT